MENYLDLALTDFQELELEKARRELSNRSRAELEYLILEAMRLGFQYKNAFISVIKKLTN